MGGDRVRITVEEEKCSGHGRCYTVAPDLFESDDQGFVTARGTEFDVPTGQESAARKAVGSCPEDAIRLLDEEATSVASLATRVAQLEAANATVGELFEPAGRLRFKGGNVFGRPEITAWYARKLTAATKHYITNLRVGRAEQADDGLLVVVSSEFSAVQFSPDTHELTWGSYRDLVCVRSSAATFVEREIRVDGRARLAGKDPA
jgi:ferredoxin